MAGIGLSMKTRRDMSGRIIFFTSQKGGAAPNSNPEISRYVFDAAPPFIIKFRFLLFCRLLKFLRPKEMPEPLPHALFPEAACRFWDCPIPPPIVRGSLPSRSILWKGRFLLSSQPAFVSCSSRAFSSTRIPMEEISRAHCKGSCQKRISQFNFQSS